MRDVARFLISIPVSLMWLAICYVFIVGTGHVTKSVFGEDASGRWPAATFAIVGLGFLALASNLFFERYFGYSIAVID